MVRNTYRKVLLVELDDAFGALDLRILEISIQREAVRDLVAAHVVRDASEAIDWEGLVRVVSFENGAY